MELGGDPYTAYCLDEACAYLLEQTLQKKIPRFRNKNETLEPKSNSRIVAEMMLANQRYKEAGRM